MAEFSNTKRGARSLPITTVSSTLSTGEGEMSLAQLASGGAVRNTRKKYSTKLKRLAKVGEKFERGDYTLEEYLENL